MATENDHVNQTLAVRRSTVRNPLPERWRRPVLWIVGVFLVIAFLEAIGWPFLRRPVESALTRAFAREVTIASPFAIRFIGHLRVRAGRLVLGPAPEGPALRGEARDLLRAEGLRLSVPYSTLLSLLGTADTTQGKRPYISVLEVAGLDTTLLRSADGRANWHFAADDKKDSGPLVLPRFGRLALNEGNIVVVDAVGRVKVEATVSTRQDSGGIEAQASGSYRDETFSAHLQTDGLLTLAETDASAPAAPLRLELRAGASELDFDGHARDLLHLTALDGQFRVAGPSLAAIGDTVGVTLPTTAAFAMRGTARKDGAVWSAAVSELAVGKSRLNGEFRYDPTSAVPKLTGKLGGALLAMPDLAPAVGASSGSASRAARGATPAGTGAAVASPGRPAVVAQKPAPARVLPQREFDTPSLAKMDADVAVALEAFDLGTAKLEKMAPLRAHIVLENQVLIVKDIVARTASGELLGLLSFDARQANPLWKADLRWSGVQLERFVKARDIADRNRSTGYISGVLSGRARLSGSGRSTAAILASLDGDTQLWVRDGKISHFLVEVLGLDIAQALGLLVRGDAALPIRCAVTALAVHQGKLTPQVALIETSDSTLRVSGSISLADERLGLVFKAEPKDFSPMTLRSPVFVEGSFSDPEVNIEKTAIGMRVVAAAALAAITPLAGILALIDLGEGEKKACQEAFERAGNPGQRAPARRR